MSFLEKKLNGKILLSIVLILIISSGIIAYMLLNNDNNKIEQKENNNEVQKNEQKENNNEVQKNEQQVKVLLSGNLDYEINSELNLLSLISEDNEAEIISEDQTIDTSTLGKKEIVIKYKNNGEEKEYKFEINVVDTTTPTIEYESELSTTQGTEIDLLKDVKVSDNSNEEIKATIEGNYDFNKVGTYNLKYVAVDSSNNKIEKEFVLKVNKKKTTSTNNSSSSYKLNTTTNTTKPSTNNNSNNTSNNSSKNETTTTTPTVQPEQPKLEETKPTITKEQANEVISNLYNEVQKTHPSFFQIENHAWYGSHLMLAEDYKGQSYYDSLIPNEYKENIKFVYCEYKFYYAYLTKVIQTEYGTTTSYSSIPRDVVISYNSPGRAHCTGTDYADKTKSPSWLWMDNFDFSGRVCAVKDDPCCRDGAYDATSGNGWSTTNIKKFYQITYYYTS